MEDYIVHHSSKEAPIFIDGPTVYKLLDIPSMLEVLRSGLVNFSAGDAGGVVMPVRTVIPVGMEEGKMAIMPAFSGKDSACAVKLVSVFPSNAQRGLSSHSATVFLVDTITGALLSLMDGCVITALRTAGVSALAVKTFAPTSSGVVAILGSGVQARSHLIVLQHTYSITQVRIYSRTMENAQKFAAEVMCPVVVCDSAEEAVRGADVIVTATLSPTPILCGEWVKKGAVIAAVGAYQPHTRELDSALMQFSAVIVDSRAGASKESGDVILSKAEIRAELGQVLAGKRSDFVADGETVVFENLGLAIEDVVCAKLVYDKYKLTATK